MNKKEYKTPDLQVVSVKTETSLLTISGDSYNQSTSDVEPQNGGSFNSRKSGSLWDDED